MPKLSPTIMHGNAMVLFGYGLLITGKSNAGKTRLCTQLLLRGHQIIADDAVALELKNDQLHASAPKATVDKIADGENNIRSISQQFSEHALSPQHAIHFHLALDNSYQQSQLKPFLDQLLLIPWRPDFSSNPEQFELIVKNAIECHFVKSMP